MNEMIFMFRKLNFVNLFGNIFFKGFCSFFHSYSKCRYIKHSENTLNLFRKQISNIF